MIHLSLGLRISDLQTTLAPGGTSLATFAPATMTASPSTFLDSYGDAEIDVRKASVDLKRGDAEIQLEKIGLSVTNKDGKVVERSLDRLDVTKDQTGAVPKEGWVERNALALAIAFIAVSVVMATYMVLRHRKLYKREYEE